jgi:hypothetical protein
MAGLIPLAGTAAATSAPDRNFAGYLVSPATIPTGIGVQFYVPTLNCAGETTTLDVLSGVNILSAGGSHSTLSGIDLRCTGSTPSYTAQVRFDSSEITLAMAISPGDFVSLGATSSTEGSSRGTVDDLSTQVTQTVGSTGFTGDGGGKFGVFSTVVGANEAGVAPFGSIKYINATLDTGPLRSSNPTAFNRVNGKIRQITTSRVERIRHFQGFKVWFNHS